MISDKQDPFSTYGDITKLDIGGTIVTITTDKGRSLKKLILDSETDNWQTADPLSDFIPGRRL
jgi:hypothetical protein